jgi:hypothetical protein
MATVNPPRPPPRSPRMLPAGLLLERSSKLQSDRQQGGDATTSGGVLYIKCTGTCCADRPLELHSAGGCIYSGNAFEAHAGACVLQLADWHRKKAVLCAAVVVVSCPDPCCGAVTACQQGQGLPPCVAAEATVGLSSAQFTPSARFAQCLWPGLWPGNAWNVPGRAIHWLQSGPALRSYNSIRCLPACRRPQLSQEMAGDDSGAPALYPLPPASFAYASAFCSRPVHYVALATA